MPRRTIDLVAAGPPSADLYDPASAAWALAAALAARGHDVQALFPGTTENAVAPPGVALAAFPAVTAHLGSCVGDAELARVAGHRIRASTELVVRDPSGFGPLGHRAGRAPITAFLRGFAQEEGEGAARAAAPARGLLGWRERRSAHRLEKQALSEARVVYCGASAQRQRLEEDYGLPADRLRVRPPVVARGPDAPSREAARRLVGVPDDVLLALVLPPVDPDPTRAVAPALEAFGRTRLIFPGARLAVVGAPGAKGPGVVDLGPREAQTLQAAVTAADVAVVVRASSAADPGFVFALRAGVPCVADPSVDLGEGSESAVRRAPTADAGELASVLAGLLADPEARRSLGEAGRAISLRFDPDHLAAEVEGVVAAAPS